VPWRESPACSDGNPPAATGCLEIQPWCRYGPLASAWPSRGSGAAAPQGARFARLIHPIGAAVFLADLRSGPPPAASQPALAATQGGRRPTVSRGLLSCHGDTARTADLPSLTDLRDHDGPGHIPGGTAIGTGACLGVTRRPRRTARPGPRGQFGDRFPKWVGSATTDRSEVRRDHLRQRTGRRAQGHRQGRGVTQAG